jgi:sialic acid synthase SpsE
MIERFSKFKLPIILSSGMSNEQEIEDAITASGFHIGNQNTAILVCTSLYPTEGINVNLMRISTLKKKYKNLVVGFSDHTVGNLASIAAVALGSKIFEKHFTLDHNLPGPDHWFSLDPDEAKCWVESIRNTYKLLGNGELIPCNDEVEMRTLARRSIVVINDISIGEVLNSKNIGIMRPGNGIKPSEYNKFIGKKSKSNLKVGQLISYKDI